MRLVGPDRVHIVARNLIISRQDMNIMPIKYKLVPRILSRKKLGHMTIHAINYYTTSGIPASQIAETASFM